jgi:hypothetical protein
MYVYIRKEKYVIRKIRKIDNRELNTKIGI